MARKNQKTLDFLEELTGEPLSFGALLHAIREGEEESLAKFSERLGVSRQYLHQIEQGHRNVGLEQAARFAKVLGYGSLGFVKLSLQDMVDKAGIKATVDVKAA